MWPAFVAKYWPGSCNSAVTQAYCHVCLKIRSRSSARIALSEYQPAGRV